MRSLFLGVSVFNGDVSTWNVSNVKTMRTMFANRPLQPGAFNQDLFKWDVSSVEDMNAMFQYDELFNQNLSKYL